MLIEHRPGHPRRTPTSTSTPRPSRRGSSATTWRRTRSCSGPPSRRARCRSRPRPSSGRSGSTASRWTMNLARLPLGPHGGGRPHPGGGRGGPGHRAGGRGPARAERRGAGAGGRVGSVGRAPPPARDPRARADRVPERGLRAASTSDFVRRVVAGGGGARPRQRRGSRRPSRGTSTSSWPTRTSTRWRACISTRPSTRSSQASSAEHVRTYWHLHPPLLRALGLKKKLRLGAWFAPAFRMLRAMKRPARHPARSLRLRGGAAGGAGTRRRVPPARSRPRSRGSAPSRTRGGGPRRAAGRDPRLRAHQARGRGAVPGDRPSSSSRSST